MIKTIPNADIFIYMYVRREAVYSSQIEGSQSTLEDLLAGELEPQTYGLDQDINEVVNYVKAMNYGLERLSELPISLRLIREIHGELLHRGRGSDRRPGEFRENQNWIGEEGAPITRATFIPPHVAAMKDSLSDFESFLHRERQLPDLIHVGLAHAQFETIHPFQDGNGRVGRLLITFLLINREVLHRPLLYLSLYLKRHRAEYYDRLMAVRETGDWEGWLRFFLRGVEETAKEATATAGAIVETREAHYATVHQWVAGNHGPRLLELLFARPLTTINVVSRELGVHYVTASKLIEQFVKLGLLVEVTGRKRDRIFSYDPYLALFREEDDGGLSAESLQTTEAVEAEAVG